MRGAFDRLAGIGRRTPGQSADHDPIDARVTSVDVRSAALGLRRRFYVYAPPRHDPRREQLPALYLFRGHEREWINPQQDASRQGRTVIDVYEDLLRIRRIGRMLLVFPGTSSDDNTIPGMLINLKAPTLTRASGIGRGRFEDYFLHEIIPTVERRFGAHPAARSTDGFSLGGFMAVKIAAQHPQLFRSVGAYDGLYFWDEPGDPNSIADHDGTFRSPMFDPAFGPGDQRDRRFAAANNPTNLVRTGDAQSLARLMWMIEHGPQRGEPNDSNFYRGEQLCARLAERGIVNHGRGAIESGAHTWRSADEHIRYVLPLHWEALSRP